MRISQAVGRCPSGAFTRKCWCTPWGARTARAARTTGRSRALETIQKRGQLYRKRGDYAAWAVESSGEIGQAWEVPNFGNQLALGVLVTGRNLEALSDGALQNVRTALEEKKLMGVLVEVLRAEVERLNFEFSMTPDTPELRLAAENALRTYIREAGRDRRLRSC